MGHLQLGVVLVIDVEHIQTFVVGRGAARGGHMDIIVIVTIVVMGPEGDQGLEQRVVTVRFEASWTLATAKGGVEIARHHDEVKPAEVVKIHPHHFTSTQMLPSSSALVSMVQSLAPLRSLHS